GRGAGRWVGGPRRGRGGPRANERPAPPHPLAIDRRPRALQEYRHPPAAVEWGPEELLADQPHQPQVLLRRGGRPEVVGRSAEAQQIALPPDAQMRILGFDQGPLEVSRRGQLFFSTTRAPC